MIEAATLFDIDVIVRIEEELFCDPWKKADFEYELKENPFAFLHVLKEKEEIIGYIDYWITYETCQIASIAVEEVHQGKGYGNQLLEHCMNHAIESECHNISLEVRVSNMKAKNLYESYGFIPITIKSGYYKNGEDAYFMVKILR